MKVISAQSKLKPFVLKAGKVREDAYRAPKIWSSLLEEISRKTGAAILIHTVDEAEVVLGRRLVMSEYASVAVKAHQQMLGSFLVFIDGLQTKKYPPSQAPLIILATNLKEDIDEAFRSRAKISICFELPSAAQCSQWWADRGARHLAHSQFGALEFVALGRLSSLARLSFRELGAIADRMVLRDAQRQRTGGSAGQVGFFEYVMEIVWEARSNLPLWTKVLRNAESELWTARNVMFFLDRFGIATPRARARL